MIIGSFNLRGCLRRLVLIDLTASGFIFRLVALQSIARASLLFFKGDSTTSEPVGSSGLNLAPGWMHHVLRFKHDTTTYTHCLTVYTTC